jgi:hypothetical protein
VKLLNNLKNQAFEGLIPWKCFFVSFGKWGILGENKAKIHPNCTQHSLPVSHTLFFICRDALATKPSVCLKKDPRHLPPREAPGEGVDNKARHLGIS